MTVALTRVATATAGSAIAIIALVGAKAASGGDDGPLALPSTAATANQTVPANQPAHPNQPAPANTSTAAPAPAPAPASKGSDGAFTGKAANTPYGPVQVEITVTGGKISDVRMVQCPTATPRDQMICQQAVPYLVNETIAAQTANVQAVGGATYTSRGYKTSLQSAIDQAGL